MRTCILTGILRALSSVTEGKSQQQIDSARPEKCQRLSDLQWSRNPVADQRAAGGAGADFGGVSDAAFYEVFERSLSMMQQSRAMPLPRRTFQPAKIAPVPLSVQCFVLSRVVP